MTKTPKDTGREVRARLLRLARERGEDFQLVLTRYVNERLLYRLATSPYGSRFVLKGGTLVTRRPLEVNISQGTCSGGTELRRWYRPQKSQLGSLA